MCTKPSPIVEKIISAHGGGRMRAGGIATVTPDVNAINLGLVVLVSPDAELAAGAQACIEGSTVI